MTRALPSVLKQTYGNIEIIVAAHGSSEENIRALARASVEVYFAERDFVPLCVPRYSAYPPTAENHWLAGPVAPANAALRLAKGDWIARIDDDDTWTPDRLEKLLCFAQANDFEFVSAAHETHEGKVAPYDLMGTKIGGTQTWLYRSYLRFFRYNPDCWRKTWHRVNDTDLQHRMWRAGVRMGYLDEVVAKVLPRPGENAVGLRAYREDRANKERQMAFD